MNAQHGRRQTTIRATRQGKYYPEIAGNRRELDPDRVCMTGRIKVASRPRLWKLAVRWIETNMIFNRFKAPLPWTRKSSSWNSRNRRNYVRIYIPSKKILWWCNNARRPLVGCAQVSSSVRHPRVCWLTVLVFSSCRRGMLLSFSIDSWCLLSAYFHEQQQGCSLDINSVCPPQLLLNLVK